MSSIWYRRRLVPHHAHPVPERGSQCASRGKTAATSLRQIEAADCGVLSRPDGNRSGSDQSESESFSEFGRLLLGRKLANCALILGGGLPPRQTPRGWP